MNSEHTKYLYKTFPNLYQQHKLNLRQTCMCWGFDCGDGWFDLVRNLSEKLEPMGAVAVQVKEKFGGLRFYVDHCTTEMYELIDEAEAASMTICELCGKPGEIHGSWWLAARCDECLGDYDG